MKFKSQALAQLFQILHPYRLQIIMATFLTLLPAFFTVWGPYFVGRLVDEGLIAKDVHALVLFASAIFALKIFLFFFNTMVTYCLSAFGSQILVDYRSQLLGRILAYPISFFDRISAGKLTTRLTSDINTLQELFSSALVPLIGNIFLILGVMVAMLFINWKLAVVSFTIIPILIWFTAIFHVRIRRRFGFMRQALSSLNAFSGESFSGNRDIQVFDAVSTNQLEFERFSKKLQVRFNQAVREYGLYNPVVPLITSMMNVLIIAYGGWQIYRGTMTVEEVVAFLAYASHFEWPIRDFSEKYTVLQQALSAVDRLVEISQHSLEKDEGKEEFKGNQSIEFKNVEFRYEKKQAPAVNGLSFRAKPGEKIALLGETGSGKTTTCSLLMRFYETTSGQILIDGKDSRSYSLDSLRSRIGWVSQDVILFSTSLRENLRFYDTSVTDAELWHLLDQIQLKSWVENLPHGLNEMLSERGSTISSGQRQLISLARALLRKPSILIFDEATAYIDSHTEYLLQKAVEELFEAKEFQGMTGFFIAHRLSTLKRCDRMLVFKGGQIVESGTYEELMQLNGYAAKLYREDFRKLA